MTRPSLVGKYLMRDLPDGQSWMLGRFRERITKYLYLVETLSPSTGEPMQYACYLLDLRLMMLHPGEECADAKIFDDYAAVQRFLEWMEEPAPEKVVKLVRS